MKVLVDGKEIECQNSVCVLFENQLLDVKPSGKDVYGDLQVQVTHEGLIVDSFIRGRQHKSMFIDDLNFNPSKSGVTMAKDTKKLNGELYDDATGKTLKASAQFVNGRIMIHVEGYGDSCSGDGLGEPVVIDFFDNKVQAIVWSDINRQDPTDSISIEGAKESLRIRKEII